MEDSRERRRENDIKNQPWVIGIVGGGLLLFSLIVFIILVLPRTHLTLEAKCSVLEDPKLENKTAHGTMWRASVPVEVISYRDGYGSTLLKHHAMVFNSVAGSWTYDKQAELNFTMKHCLCPGCTGKKPGKCEECVPRTPGCEEEAPEFTCYMDVSNPQATFPTYSVNIHHVRFRKDLVNDDRTWWICLTVFSVLAGIFLVVAIVLYLPGLLRGDGHGQYKPLESYDD